jgi:hypothetical protein
MCTFKDKQFHIRVLSNDERKVHTGKRKKREKIGMPLLLQVNTDR